MEIYNKMNEVFSDIYHFKLRKRWQLKDVLKYLINPYKQARL